MTLVLAVLVAASGFILVALAAVCRHGYRAAARHFDRHAELLHLPLRRAESEQQAA